MSDTNEELYLSPSQVAKYASLTPYNARKFILDGLEPAFKSGKFSFYKRTDVLKRLDEPLGITLSRLGLLLEDEDMEAAVTEDASIEQDESVLDGS